MKVIIAGGGTGGHLYPGIAIAREVLKERGNEVLFVGTEQGIEARVLPREGLPVRFISVGKLKGMKLAVRREDGGDPSRAACCRPCASSGASGLTSWSASAAIPRGRSRLLPGWRESPC